MAVAAKVTGNPARRIVDQGMKQGRRLVAVPDTLLRAKTRKARLAFTLMIAVSLVFSAAALLMLNVSVSTSQYQIVELQQELKSLQYQNESLEAKADVVRHPGHLQKRAEELGMVQGGTAGVIDVESMKVRGNPSPAAE